MAVNDILASALNGLADATSRANRAADRIVRAGAGLGADAEPFKLAPARGKSAPLPTGPNLGQASAAGLGGRYIPSIEEEVVQLRIAVQAYKANAALIRTADELLAITNDSLKR